MLPNQVLRYHKINYLYIYISGYIFSDGFKGMVTAKRLPLILLPTQFLTLSQDQRERERINKTEILCHITGDMEDPSPSSIDLNNPLFVPDKVPPTEGHHPDDTDDKYIVSLKPKTFRLTPLNPSSRDDQGSHPVTFDTEVVRDQVYRWKVRVVSPCSVTCASGILTFNYLF